MAKTPCAVFWDIQNIGVPRGQSAASIVSLIRSSIINLYNLREIYFYCVCDVTKLPANVGNPLTNQDVNIIQAYDYTKDSADIKILDLMRKFVENQGRKGCAIILLSGDGDYAGTLIDLKKLYNITIFVIRLANSFSVKLETAANYTFKLTGRELQPIKSSGLPQFFVSFSRFPRSRGMRIIRAELNGMTQPYGSIDKSAIDHEDQVIIGFPSLELAIRAATRFDKARYHGTFLKAEVLQNPPTEIIIKVQNSCSSDVPISKQPQPVKKVNLEHQVLPDNQPLTFIKVSQLTDLLSEAELTHHFAKLTIPYESKYVKFHQSSIWIAFLSANQAQEALNKLKSSLLIGKPIIASITSPPLDLLRSSVRQELTVSSNPPFASFTPPQQLSSSLPPSQSQSTLNSADEQNPIINISTDNLGNHYLSKGATAVAGRSERINYHTLESTTQSDGVNQNYYICLSGYSEAKFQTKWSLTYKFLFETRDYHPNKLFIEDEVVWLWFKNETNYSQALTQIKTEFIKAWPCMKVDATASPKLNLSELAAYNQSNPWCFTSDFELYFLKVDAIEVFTDEIEREIRETFKGTQVDHKLNCIFVKLKEESIWAAFPDLMCCLDAEFLVSTHQQIRSSIKLTWTKAAPIELLQSIGLNDLIGEAKCLAELLVTPEKSHESINNFDGVDDDSVMLTSQMEQNFSLAAPQMIQTEVQPVKVNHQSSVNINEVDSLSEPQPANSCLPTNLTNTFICLMGTPNATCPTYWSLFINIVKKIMLMGLKKIILFDEIFWCKFENETDCQTVFKRLQSNQMNLLPLIHVTLTPQPTANLTAQLAFHQSCSPFCITSELRLHFMRCTLLDPITNSSTVDEMVNDVKKLLTITSKVIFVKADQNNTIWAGFPSGRTCDSAIVTIYKRNTWKIRVDLLHIKNAPVTLLPLIQTKDLFGEALELTQRWMEHIKKSSKSNSIIKISSSSSSLSGSSTQSTPETQSTGLVSGIQFESQTTTPKVVEIKVTDVTRSPRRSRPRRRTIASREPSSVKNEPLASGQKLIKPFVALNSKWIQFANIRNQFICFTGVTNAEFTTFWSLMYNIVSQTIDHRIYKVIMEGGDFWIYFENENQCQQVIKKINKDANFFKSMKMKKSISPSKKLVTTISSYHPDSPWCFTHNLGLNYLKSSFQDPKGDVNSSETAQSLVDIIKSVSNEFKCIFVKFYEGTVWAGFPSIRTCDNAKKKLNTIIVQPVLMQTVHPRLLPTNLLESIGNSDLIGDALTLSQRWFEMRNAPSDYSTRSSDKSDLPPQINFITTSMSIDSDTDSNSVISDHINTDRYQNHKPYSSDGEGGSTAPIPIVTYMVNKVSSYGVGGQGVFLTIGDVFQLPRGRFLWKKQIVQTFVDFIDIPPRAACLDNNVVHFHYNTLEEAERGKRFIEIKLFEDFIQLKATISNDAPACWSVKQKYYFSLPRTLPAPARRQITYIIISPVSKKDSRSLNNSLLAALQPFYVYFIRHFEEALWIGIGDHEQAEAATAAFIEQKLLNGTLTVKIEKRLPRDFWKIIRAEIKPTSTNDVANLPTSKGSSVNGSTNQLNQPHPDNKSTTAKILTSVLSQTAASAGVSSASNINQLETQQQNAKIKSSHSPVFVFPGAQANGANANISITFVSPESPNYTQLPSTSTSSSTSKVESGLKFGYRSGYDQLSSNGSVSTLVKPTTFTTINTTDNDTTTITSSTKPNNDASSNDSNNRSLTKEITTILTDPSTSYLVVTVFPITVLTKQAVSHVRFKLVKSGCLFVTKLPDSICSGFNSSEKRNKAQREIDGSDYTDIFGHNFTFLTRFLYNPPLNLSSIIKTSDLTLLSVDLSPQRQDKSLSSNPLSIPSFNFSNSPTQPAKNCNPVSTVSHPSYQETLRQQENSPIAPNTSKGNSEDSASSKKSTKKSKQGPCLLS